MKRVPLSTLTQELTTLATAKTSALNAIQMDKFCRDTFYSIYDI